MVETTHCVPLRSLRLPQLCRDRVRIFHVDGLVSFSRTFPGDTSVVDPLRTGYCQDSLVSFGLKGAIVPYVQNLNTLGRLCLDDLDRLHQRLLAGNVNFDTVAIRSAFSASSFRKTDLRDDFAPLFAVAAVSFDDVFQLGLVPASDEHLAAVLDKGEGNHKTDT